MNLFEMNERKFAPLADRMRPTNLSEFVGQKHILGEGKILRKAIEKDALTNCIFFGPPGCGKTTVASIIEHTTSANFFRLNAVTSGVADVRKVIEEAQASIKVEGKRSYLLLDECHRWSKSQSDSILPALEKGTITFIGSTTENPMIAMTSAIVSRCRVFEFYPISVEDIMIAVKRAITDKENGYGDSNIIMSEQTLEQLARLASGDIRTAMNAVELAVSASSPNEFGEMIITTELIEESIQRRTVQCDDDQFYDMLSGFCKSLRGSDNEAALYWAFRMIYAGVDPRIIARRMIVHASEDVGLADPMAVLQAQAALVAVEKIGMPEAGLAISQGILYICNAPKSNSVLNARSAAMQDVKNGENKPVPMHLRDTHYSGAEKLGHGEGYKYPHDYSGHFVAQRYLPKGMENSVYYQPSDQGFEVEIQRRMEERKDFTTDND